MKKRAGGGMVLDMDHEESYDIFTAILGKRSDGIAPFQK